jgi:hypothetical protein
MELPDAEQPPELKGAPKCIAPLVDHLGIALLYISDIVPWNIGYLPPFFGSFHVQSLGLMVLGGRVSEVAS